MRLHKLLIAFALSCLAFQFILLVILSTVYSALPSQLMVVLTLMVCLSFPPLFVYQMILSRGPGGVMYYAHAINMLCMLRVFMAKEAQKISVYSYSPGLLFIQLLLLHPAPLMLVFTVIGYLVFRALLRGAVGHKLVAVTWVLGPLLYIAALIPVSLAMIRVFAAPTPPVTYHFPFQLGLIVWFFYHAVPGPFTSLATMSKYLRLLGECEARLP